MWKPSKRRNAVARFLSVNGSLTAKRKLKLMLNDNKLEGVVVL
jgi:hypothetical protein